MTSTLPAVIDAADAVALGAAEEQRGCSGAGSGDPDDARPDPCCRGTRSAARPAAAGAWGAPPPARSDDRRAGQYWRIKSPIRLPGPTRVGTALSRAEVACLPYPIVRHCAHLFIRHLRHASAVKEVQMPRLREADAERRLANGGPNYVRGALAPSRHQRVRTGASTTQPQ